MREFESVETFEITGRGIAYAIKGNWTGTGEIEWTPACMTGETVKINGEEFRVKGVEIFMVYAGPTQPYRSSFALLT